MNKLIIEENSFDRIDKYLVTNLEGYSRERIQNLLANGNILVNGKNVKANYKIKKNDEITIEEPEPEIVDIKPVNIPINVVYEDEDLLVINKQTGLVVHPSIGHSNDTLVNALMYHIKDLSSINGEIRPGIVHRIDKDTSGLLVVAKSDEAHKFLASQLEDKSLSRKYLAIVQGEIPHELGKINAPIGRDPKDRKRMACVTGGKSAVTRFKVLERFNDFTLIECQLETGRTHQIRVHLAYIGYPVAGDVTYGRRRKVIGDNGQFLHAYKIGFIHPRTKKYVEFEAEPEQDFTDLLNKLREENKITK